jgi:hypothetical protein
MAGPDCWSRPAPGWSGASPADGRRQRLVDDDQVVVRIGGSLSVERSLGQAGARSSPRRTGGREQAAAPRRPPRSRPRRLRVEVQKSMRRLRWSGGVRQSAVGAGRRPGGPPGGGAEPAAGPRPAAERSPPGERPAGQLCRARWSSVKTARRAPGPAAASRPALLRPRRATGAARPGPCARPPRPSGRNMNIRSASITLIRSRCSGVSLGGHHGRVAEGHRPLRLEVDLPQPGLRIGPGCRPRPPRSPVVTSRNGTASLRPRAGECPEQFLPPGVEPVVQGVELLRWSASPADRPALPGGSTGTAPALQLGQVA